MKAPRMAPSVRASIAMAFLYLVYRVYAAIVSPWTVAIDVPTAPDAVPRPAAPLPSDASIVAQTHLPHASWAADAEIVLHRAKEGFVYFNDSRRIEDGRQNRVRFTPFALVWFDPRREDGVPWTVTCDSAVVEFKEKFDPKFGHAEGNRIVGGRFSGEVRITGPDGLQVLGRTFELSEGQGQYGLLRSDSEQPVTFAYGPAAGESRQVRGQAVQFEFKLATGDDSLLGQDMPRISGIERIVLRQDVQIDLVIEDDGRPVPLSVDSDGRFEYDVERMVAEFNDNVRVSRPTHRPGEAQQHDTLSCDRLTLSFEPRERARPPDALSATGETPTIQPVSGTTSGASRRRGGLDLDLQLQTLTAVGREVVLTSDENQLHAVMGELFYNVSDRLLQLIDDGPVGGARVRFGSSELMCPDIRMMHDEDGLVEAALCEGAGQAWQTDPQSGQPEVEASWTERLSMAEDMKAGWDRLELIGDAYVVHRPQRMGVAGDVLRVWFDGRQLQTSGGQFQLDEGGSSSPDRLAIHRITAEQTSAAPVALESPRIRLESGRIEAEFAVAEPDRTPDGAHGADDPFRSSGESGADEPPLVVRAGDIRASVAVDPATRRSELLNLTASTDVHVRREALPATPEVANRLVEGAFSVECETLDLTNGANGEVLHLLGAPAFIRLPKSEIEGRDLMIDRGQNSAHVEGPGTIEFDVDRDLEGRPLEEAERLRVRWKEQMHFDGELATFLGETVTSLADSVMKCHQMDVTLNRRLSFREDAPRPGELEIAAIHCRDLVTLEYHEFSDPRPGERSVVTGFRQLEVAEFRFDRSTGNFVARGPGKVEDWRLDDGRKRVTLSPRSISRPNQAAQVDALPWSYTWLKFAGEINGNQPDRWMVLKDRVEVIHGPVQHPLQPIFRRDLDADTETARNSVWLRSDQMNLQLRSGGPDRDDWLEVVALGNAELEGKVFRALADMITYDQSSEQFTLKGRGTDAEIYYQEAPGASDQPNFAARTIRFVPSRRKIELDESSGVRFVP